MKTIAEMRNWEMRMRYMTPSELYQDWLEIDRWWQIEWTKLHRVSELTKAVLKDDSDTLAKAADTVELTLAKAHAARLVAAHGDHADWRLINETLERMAKLLQERNARDDKHYEEARRARRYTEAWSYAPLRAGPWEAH
jgi:hypothetical protein